jgi:zinc protease
VSRLSLPGFFRFASFFCLAASGLCAWPEISSDLAADPAARFGTLPNGVRTAILHNAEPRGRVTLRLLVRVGSMHERDDEQGLAHFLEHMVFRGTRQHPGDTMTAALQRLGIGFGPESSAFTHYDHTIYHLELPDAEESTLRQGLNVFREYAGEVTFEPKLIERERGVILSEKETRDTPDARSANANLAFLWPQALQVNRSPIGLESAVRSFTRAQFVSFYDRWYQPDRMAIIAVGDIAPEMVERLIAEVFGTLQRRAPPETDEVTFVPAAASPANIRIFSDPGLIGAICTLQHPFRDERSPDSHARRVQSLHRALAFGMFHRRVSKLASEMEGSFISPQTNVAAGLPGWSIAAFSVSGNIANWKTVVAELEREHRRAFVHGFTSSELTALKAYFLRGYEDAVRTYPTRPSSWLAAQFVASLLEGEVFATPAARQRDIMSALEATTPKDCLTAFREAWTTRPPHVFIATNPQFAVNATTVAEALNESRELPVVPLADKGLPTFAYSTFGSPGQLVRETEVVDLGVRLSEFNNGVRLNFKATSFQAQTIQVYLRIGDGRQSQPESKPGLDLLANQIVQRGGLNRHTYEELQEILASHSIDLGFGVDNDAFVFTAHCAPEDLLLCLQAITAHITDLAFRPSAMRDVHASFNSMYASLAAAPGGPIFAVAPRILAKGDRRFGLPTVDQLFARTIDETAAWLKPQFERGPIELSIVGDSEWKAVSDAVAQTLGALPARDSHRKRSDNAHAVAKPRKSAYVYTTAPHLRQVAIARYCPVREPGDVYQERRCRLLADLLAERLRVRLREELGAAYSSTASFIQHEGFEGQSYFLLYAEVSSNDALRAATLIKGELDAIRKKRFTDDDFERIKTPFLRQREQDLRENTYWSYTVLRDAQQRPERLTAARSRSTDTAAITRADLVKLAKRHLNPAESFEFIAYPAPEKPAASGLTFGPTK